MAEILISLTIIGVIAAITLPSLRANINETTWNTQRKALYSRLSQAIAMMPSLNGYGIGATKEEINEKAAQAFVTDGLSKVLQINNICDSTKLKDCGIPDRITPMSGDKFAFPNKLTDLNDAFSRDGNPQSDIDTLAAAFETKNGESVAVFYNPYCVDKTIGSIHTNNEDIIYYSRQYMCANFVYDLNGRKGPNKVGKDIGFITALYPTDNEVIAPFLHKEYMYASGKSYSEALETCRKFDLNLKVPNINELSAIFYNFQLVWHNSSLGAYVWSSTPYSERYVWAVGFYNGLITTIEKENKKPVLCVYK